MKKVVELLGERKEKMEQLGKRGSERGTKRGKNREKERERKRIGTVRKIQIKKEMGKCHKMKHEL